MDRRSTPRHFVTDTPVRLTLLSADGTADVALPGWLTDWSAQGMRVAVDSPLSAGTPVKVEWGDQLALGDVSHCLAMSTETNAGRFSAGLRISQVLTGLGGLRKLSERLMGEERRPAAEPQPEVSPDRASHL